jgi:hypothetical protein
LLDKLENSIKERQDYDSINALFREFENSVDIKQKISSKNFIHNAINSSVENVIDDLVTSTINADSTLIDSKNVKDTMTSIENFILNSNFGTFEYTQKTGRNIIKVKHSMGINGSNFCKKFFERIFGICLNDYSFHIIYDEYSVCVIFR